ncbi:hypothetical protein ABID82_005158 [Methylobacterium sp. PvP062]|uniref:Uncharacterized protein n=2 Tax=Methylobacterium radiotolerans TaxID=31998 RepID=A0ABV2NUC4_9HYPH|nr:MULTISPECIES: hypothetical protein [unclassified Methylobacterium]MBP2498267.1 hypothetical protein [Methylobacterium sp. PvP105]MBP2505651.1 hypothetical protein [Methylobacterium sp. PvP109]
MSDALDELRKRLKAVADEAAAAAPTTPKVFHIFSRKPYEPAPETGAAPKRVRPPKRDKQAIEALTELLEDYRAGRLHGLCLIGWNIDESRIEQHVILPPGKSDHEAALLFSGGAVMLNQALQDIAEFGLENMRDGNEVVLMDGPEDAL